MNFKFPPKETFWIIGEVFDCDPDIIHCNSSGYDGCDPETALANQQQDAALKFNGKSWVADGTIPTRDVGDLLTGIDEDCGAAIERAAQRFLPRPEAKDVRRELVRRIGDKVVAHDAKSAHKA